MYQGDNVESSKQAKKRAKKNLHALVAAVLQKETGGLKIIEESIDHNVNENEGNTSKKRDKEKCVKISKDKGKEMRMPKFKENEVRSSKDKRNNIEKSRAKGKESDQEKRGEGKEVREDDSDFLNLLNDIHMRNNVPKYIKKVRGPTKLLGATTIGENIRMKVEWNERGQPVGKNSEKFCSLIGVLAKEMVPLNVSNWTKVDKSVKNAVWYLLLQKFIIEECHKKYVFRLCGKLWRNWKSMLSKKLAKTNSPSCKPPGVKEYEWNEFVKVRRSLEWNQLSMKMKKVRSQLTYPHTLSRKGYARLEHDLKAEKGSNQPIPRVELWIKGRIKKDGNIVNNASMVTMKKMKESSQDSNSKSLLSIKDDVLSKVLGHENPGYIRGLGFGATSSLVDAQLQVTSWKQSMNNKMNEVMERQKVMEDMIFQLTSSMNIGGSDNEHACASRDASASHQNDKEKLEGKSCKLLHWIASGEVVANGEIASTDPSSLVHGVLLGPDCYKVWVKDILISNVVLPRPSRDLFTVDEAFGSTVAWPHKYINFL